MSVSNDHYEQQLVVISNSLPKVVLLGDSNTGKSSLVHRFVSDEFIVLESTTAGAAYVKTAKFELWDTAGQERYKSIAPRYYAGAEAAIVVFDVTNEESFTDGAVNWVKELKIRGRSGIVIALVGNKIDITDLREVEFEVAAAFAGDQGLIYMETSAKDGVNVKELFEELERRLARFPSSPSVDEYSYVDNVNTEPDVWTSSGPDGAEVLRLRAMLELIQKRSDILELRIRDKETEEHIIITELIEYKMACAVKDSEMEELRHKCNRLAGKCKEKDAVISRLRSELEEYTSKKSFISGFGSPFKNRDSRRDTIT